MDDLRTDMSEGGFSNPAALPTRKGYPLAIQTHEWWETGRSDRWTILDRVCRTAFGPGSGGGGDHGLQAERMEGRERMAGNREGTPPWKSSIRRVLDGAIVTSIKRGGSIQAPWHSGFPPHVFFYVKYALIHSRYRLPRPRPLPTASTAGYVQYMRNSHVNVPMEFEGIQRWMPFGRVWNQDAALSGSISDTVETPEYEKS